MDNGAGREIYKKGIEADVSTSEDEDENKVEPVSEEEVPEVSEANEEPKMTTRSKAMKEKKKERDKNNQRIVATTERKGTREFQ